MPISTHANKALLGRADLIRCLEQHDEEALESLAELFGYGKKGVKPALKTKQVSLDLTGADTAPEPKVGHNAPRGLNPGKPTLYRVVKQEKKTPRYSPGEKPQWFKEANKLTEAELVSDAERLTGPPLVRWARLWPFLRIVLGGNQATAKLDVELIAQRISKGDILKRLPHTQRLGWAPRCQILIDAHMALMPFWDDFYELHQALVKIRGESGLELLMFEQGPAGPCRNILIKGARPRTYKRPSQSTPILLLSDLGCLDRTGGRRGQWRRFGMKMSLYGFKPVALMPCPDRLFDADVVRYFHPFVWDRAAHYPRVVQSLPTQKTAPSAREREHGVEALLTLISPAVLVEPALLRAIRHLLPAAEADIGSEAVVWHHSAITPTPNMLYWRAKADPWRLQFKQAENLPRHDTALLVKQFHAWLSPALQHEENCNYAALLGQPMPEEAIKYIRRVAKTLDADDCREGFVRWARRYISRQDSQMWQAGSKSKAQLQEVLKVIYLKANEAAYRKGALCELPEGLNDISDAAWILSGKDEPVSYGLGQQGQQLVWMGSDQKEVKRSRLSQPPSRLTEFTTIHGLLECSIRSSETGVTRNEAVNLKSDRSELFSPSRGEGVVIKSDFGLAVIENMAKPTWATNIGRDHLGLYAEFTYKGITQRMRWINPGTFMMGSPEDEPERLDRETQHEVTLTEGYWLADTTVTQALWQAVMGDNPSRFKGQERPVENVSWKDAQEFIERLNQEDDDLGLRLPTEAEWEHACRAGTQTPFSFGENITTDQANYNGDNPYADGAKGEYRQKTVDVKALPYNAWGLYQMHGNVWEWCSDWYGNYPTETVNNPVGVGSDTGVFRVLHGGSWFISGSYVRSAFRRSDIPSYRFDCIGFRLARGPRASEPARRVWSGIP